jgi:hypothetical protein
VTVEELKRKVALALDDLQLKELLLGKTVEGHNTVTVHRFELLYDVNGQGLITAIDGKKQDRAVANDLTFDPETEYKILNAKIIAYVEGSLPGTRRFLSLSRFPRLLIYLSRLRKTSTLVLQ